MYRSHLFKYRIVTLLDTQQIEPKSECLDLTDMISQVVAEFTPAAIASGCTLRSEAPPLHVETDPLIIRRIVQNLISNAIRHGEGSDVLIEASERQGSAFLTVTDQGPGIAAEDQARMFEAFERAGTITDATEGLGLGLAIVQRLSVLVGASVSLSSHEGEGAAFSVGPFSIVEGIGEPIRASQQPRPEPARPAGRVLVIDDDRATLDATGALLAGWGWDVDLVSSMSDFQASELAKPDLIISDYDLGRGRSGLSAIDLVSRRFGQVPALVMTGSSSPATLALIEAAGLTVLLKPVRPVQLRSAMISLVP